MVHVYDGDTPMLERKQIIATARVLLTNPDMLHASILPQEKQFRGFLDGLTLCVLDEAHAYRGLFGSHVALVMRRLRRMQVGAHRRDPQFVVTTATMANPLEHASRLLCLPSHRLQVVGHDLDCSPQGPKRVLFWNPPLTKASLLAQGKLDLRSVP